MSEGPSFRGKLLPPGRGDRRRATLVSVLTVLFVVIAIAKPWTGPHLDQPAPSPLPTGTSVSVSAPSGPAPTGAPTAAPGATVAPSAADAFTLPLPPNTTATWATLRWRRVATGEPLNLVTSVVRWRDGFLALGRRSAGAPALTAVWTSLDGAHWQPVPFGTATTFWPGDGIVGMAASPGGGLVALTAATQSTCATAPCTSPAAAPLVAWTSSDGRAWTPHPAAILAQAIAPRAAPLLVAAGPAGLVVAESPAATVAAASTDGIHWQMLAHDSFPGQFIINDLLGAATGYLAGGLQIASDTTWSAATLWSANGRTWIREPLLPTVTAPLGAQASPGDTSSVLLSFVAGARGVVAVGRNLAAPGMTLWWQSPGGRTWRPLPTYGPLGLAPCAGQGCGFEPNGTLVGDGQRIIAVRGGADAGAWTSSDGKAWRRLAMTGDLPDEQATEAVLLPGGLLLSDGSTTWFGAAGS